MAAATSLYHLLLAPKPRTHPKPSRLPSRSGASATPLPRRRRLAPAISAAASDLLSPAPSLKSRLAAGDTLYGLFLLSFSPTLAVRGAAHPIVRASAYGLDDSYLSRCEDDTLIMCQVETAAGIAEIDAIAAVDGVDVVQMGPLDLSASMGYLWDPGNRKVRATLREAEKKVLEARKKKVAAALDGNAAYLGGFAMQNDPPEQLKLRGYHMVAGAVDIAMFRKAALDDVKRFREAVMEIGEEGDDEEGEKEEKENDGYWSE